MHRALAATLQKNIVLQPSCHLTVLLFYPHFTLTLWCLTVHVTCVHFYFWATVWLDCVSPSPPPPQVIYALNTKNDEHEAAIATLKEAHEEEVQQILSETREKILQVHAVFFSFFFWHFAFNFYLSESRLCHFEMQKPISSEWKHLWGES